LSPADIKTLQVSAPFVKGKAAIRGTNRYFHLQITASGLTDLGNNSEANLFKKVPDVDLLNGIMQSDKTTVVLTLRGIGEMSTMNPDSRVGLAQTRVMWISGALLLTQCSATPWAARQTLRVPANRLKTIATFGTRWTRSPTK
jgi:hypothetical protein